MTIAVIGGGAAGFFAALSAKRHHPKAQVVLYEKSNKLLAKVRVSGGGRCNVTNGSNSIKELTGAYPRGGRQLKQLFREFGTQHTMAWFNEHGVPLKVEDDGRVFPTTNNSQSIIDCLMSACESAGIRIHTGMAVLAIKPGKGVIDLEFQGERPSKLFEKVIVATGGSPKKDGLIWLERMGHMIVDPVPSLFTFNMPKAPITELMGVVAENASVSIQGTKMSSEGPLLITHWGMSGPAILKLSAYGARLLNELNYTFNAQVNWVNVQSHKEVSEQLVGIAEEHPSKMLVTMKAYPLPERLWSYLLHRTGLDPRSKWSDLGKKGRNKLVDTLTHDVYAVTGKTTFKEEFVTCGGVALPGVDMSTMQSKVCPGLYFAGEVLDIDAITGGYNFQAAWTTGYIAGKLR